MNFLRQLTLDLNNWCISVEEKAGDINLPSMSALRFLIDRHTLDYPHMPLTAALYPVTSAPCPAPNQEPSATATHLTNQIRAPRGGRSRWTPPA